VSWPQENPFDLSHWVGHLVSVGAIIGTIAGYLPAVAAIIAMLWYLVQLYESGTVQSYLRGRRDRKIAKLTMELARWQAKKLLHELPADPGTLADDGEYRVKSSPSPKP